MNTEEQFKYWRKRIFISLWITYATFYLCRVNFSVAIPGIMDEFGYTRTVLGGIATALFGAYAVGQFVNGQLGDKFGGRLLITVGLITSGILNIIFGFSEILVILTLIWAMNGYFQSMGWAPSVKTIANWFPLKLRGRVGGAYGSSYQIGAACSLALAGFLAGALGWRWCFWIPGVIVIASAIHCWIRVRNAPEEVGLPTIEEEANTTNESKGIRKDHHLGFSYTIKALRNPAIWFMGFGLFALNIVRYGFMVWAPSYMFEVQHAAISTAAYKTMMIPLAGSVGAIFAGWMSDKVFQSRRAPIAAIMLFLLGLSAWLFPQIPVEMWMLSLLCLIAIGFMTYGPHVLIVASAPMDYGTRKAASSATGFIDGVGYIGAALTGILSGWLTDVWGWDAAFYLWIGASIVAGVLMLLLWNYKPEKREWE